MMILRSAPASPFARKVRIAASLIGLENDIKLEQADTTDPKDALRTQNPLGKIPTLILEQNTIPGRAASSCNRVVVSKILTRLKRPGVNISPIKKQVL